jgi:hypothetical protein
MEILFLAQRVSDSGQIAGDEMDGCGELPLHSGLRLLLVLCYSL